MGFLQGTAWVLVGVVLGTSTCCVLVGPPPLHASISAVPLASMTIMAMLASTLHTNDEPSRIAR